MMSIHLLSPLNEGAAIVVNTVSTAITLVACCDTYSNRKHRNKMLYALQILDLGEQAIEFFGLEERARLCAEAIIDAVSTVIGTIS